MIASFIRRIKGGVTVLKNKSGSDAVPVGIGDDGILIFGSPRTGATIQAVDNANTQTVAGNKTFSGTNTHSGGNTFSGAVTFSAATAGVRRAVSVAASANVSVTAAASGTVYIDTLGSGTSTFTLPAASTAGLTYSFVCGDAAGEIIVAVGTGDNIIGKTHGAENGTGISTTATTGVLKNTAASNVLGDFTTLVSDGTTHWYMVSVAGVWAAA